MIKVETLLGENETGILRGFYPNMGKKEIKSNDSLKLNSEKKSLKSSTNPSKDEELFIEYNAYGSKNCYDELRIIYKFYFYDKYCLTNAPGDFLHFIHTEKRTEEVLKEYNSLLEELISIISNRFGSPKKKTSDVRAYKKTEYTWSTLHNGEEVFISILDYFNDEQAHAVEGFNQTLQIVVGN